MKTPLIDSHAHLDFDRFDTDRSEVLERARLAGVDTVVTIGTTIQSSQRALGLAQEFDMIHATAGIHPLQVNEFDDHDWHLLETMWTLDEVVGIGETGLDYYYDTSNQERQRTLFKRHLDAAVQYDMPVIIHIRDAFDDAFELMKMTEGRLRGIVHCFTGGVQECARSLELGMYISLSGIVTFRNAQALREAVPTIPSDRILVETDAPFLAPVPHRGQRNEPAFVVDTAKEVARLRGTTYEALARITRENTRRIFKLA